MGPRRNEFSPRKWIETRFLTKQTGEWYGYSYLWNDAGTDATLIDAAGMDKEFTVKTANGDRKQVWHYPSRAECMVCHSRAQNYVLGLCELQMNKTHAYPSGRSNNQLRELEHLGMFKTDWFATVKGRIPEEAKPQADQRAPKPGTLLPKPTTEHKAALVDPFDTTQKLEARAKSWLHANCSSCHVEAGGGNALMELEFATPLDKMRVVNVAPVHTTFDLKDAKLLVPGSPEKSLLVHRVGLRGPGQMPPMSSNRIDEAGLALMREWVKSMEK